MKNILKKKFGGLLVLPAMMFGFAFAVSAPAYAAEPTDCVGYSESPSINNAVNCARSEDQPGSLFSAGGIFQTVTNVLLFLIGAIAVIMLIIGGIRYTISGGDSKAVESAKNTILYAIVGIIVALLAYAIVNFVVGSLVA